MTNAAFYSGMANIAKGLLSNFGQTLTYRRVALNNYDPVNGATRATTDFTVTGIVYNYSDYRVANSGGLIKSGDRRVVVSDLDMDFEPTINKDILVVDGIEWMIINATKPVPNKVIHEFQIRSMG